LFFRLEEFRDRFKLGKDNSTRKQYEYDNSTSQECNDIMREFESSTFSQVSKGLIMTKGSSINDVTPLEGQKGVKTKPVLFF